MTVRSSFCLSFAEKKRSREERGRWNCCHCYSIMIWWSWSRWWSRSLNGRSWMPRSLSRPDTTGSCTVKMEGLIGSRWRPSSILCAQTAVPHGPLWSRPSDSTPTITTTSPSSSTPSLSRQYSLSLGIGSTKIGCNGFAITKFKKCKTLHLHYFTVAVFCNIHFVSMVFEEDRLRSPRFSRIFSWYGKLEVVPTENSIKYSYFIHLQWGNNRKLFLVLCICWTFVMVDAFDSSVEIAQRVWFLGVVYQQMQWTIRTLSLSLSHNFHFWELVGPTHWQFWPLAWWVLL